MYLKQWQFTQWHSLESYCIDKFVEKSYSIFLWNVFVVLLQYIWKFFVILSHLNENRQKEPPLCLFALPPPPPSLIHVAVFSNHPSPTFIRGWGVNIRKILSNLYICDARSKSYRIHQESPVYFRLGF